MYDTEIASIEEAKKVINSLLKTNRQLINQVEELKTSLETERKKSRLWKRIALTSIASAVAIWIALQ